MREYGSCDEGSIPSRGTKRSQRSSTVNQNGIPYFHETKTSLYIILVKTMSVPNLPLEVDYFVFIYLLGATGRRVRFRL